MDYQVRDHVLIALLVFILVKLLLLVALLVLLAITLKLPPLPVPVAQLEHFQGHKEVLNARLALI